VVIFGSLLLIFAAIALAVLGVVEASNALLVGSIVASLLSAVALVVGARQSAGVLLTDETLRPATLTPATDPAAAEPVTVGVAAGGAPVGQPLPGTGATRAPRAPLATGSDFPVATETPGAVDDLDAQDSAVGQVPAQAGPADVDDPDAAPYVPVITSLGGPDEDGDEPGAHVAYAEDDDPPDEPLVEPSTRAARARVAQLTAEVHVLDGRPRYHLAGCVFLMARDEREPLPVSEAEELGFTPCNACAPVCHLLAG
jgi:hypothetical protein